MNAHEAIVELCCYFLDACRDRETMLELKNVAQEQTRWKECHDLFGEMRTKNLAAIESKDVGLEHQYCFGEICAKTLYNMSQSEEPAPFDADSPLYVFPIALAFADHVAGKDSSRVAYSGRIGH